LVSVKFVEFEEVRGINEKYDSVAPFSTIVVP